MIISTLSTLALYCPRCGKLEMHNISRFAMKNTKCRKLLCTCGQVQATITSTSSRQLLLNIPCVLCQTNHIIYLDSKSLWHKDVNKIYCVYENFELGLAGTKDAIEATIAQYALEFENLTNEIDNEEYDEYIKNPQVMIEIINKIHDLAENGEIYCRCGSSSIGAEILPECIELLCAQCGGSHIIRAADEKDLEVIKTQDSIEIISPRRYRRKH